MKTWKGILIGVEIAIAVLIGFVTGRHCPQIKPVEPIEPKVDTLFIRDTITLSKPISVTKRVVDSVLVPVIDTVWMRDTMFVCLEREQIRWEDSLSVVYASGINPQVDSVTHHIKNMIIHEEIPVIQVKKTRWGIGIQAGSGIGKDGLTPWLGVGVSYNILTW